MACAVALANIELIEAEGLVAKTAERGRYFGQKLNDLNHHPAFGEARGAGMVYGIEFATAADRNSGPSIQQAGYHMRTICPAMILSWP